MKRRTLKYIGISILIYIFLCLTTPFCKLLRNRSIKNQIHYLSGILDKGYDDELQSRFPEGKLFSNSLLALSIIEFCERNEIVQEKYSIIVDNCIKRIQSERALSVFNPNIQPKYGMFYNGWSNYVYTTYKRSQLYRLSAIQDIVDNQSKKIEDRLIKTQTDSLRILDSYINANWPADNFIGIISLTDDSIKQRWVNTILNATEHPSGLVHHSGRDKSKIRGSSSAMITFCLKELGDNRADEYNKIFRETFIDEYLGIQLVKENENGSNVMDRDSGPVILGYGASATIMNIKTQGRTNSVKSKFTWAAMNIISLPVNIFKRKYYLMKKEPMFDLFMLWGSVELN